jgi:hypothetical protein
MALDADDLLEKMECSILAAGTAKKGKVEGREANIVEAITSADSVDWVTRGGAGGRALALSESDEQEEPVDEEERDLTDEEEMEEAQSEEATFSEQEDSEETPPAEEQLAPERVKEVVEATKLPKAARAKLLEGEYPDEDALQEAVDAEVAYIKEITGSGKPFAQGPGDPVPAHEPRTAEEADADWNRILTEVGMPHLGG